jgi:hypothetical protein
LYNQSGIKQKGWDDEETFDDRRSRESGNHSGHRLAESRRRSRMRFSFSRTRRVSP